MNHSIHDAHQWMHLQTWRFIWVHLFWFVPLSYGVCTYQGPSFYFVLTGYAWVVVMVSLYALWQIRAYLELPPNLKMILTQLSRPYAPPLYVVFNLTDAPLKLNTHFTKLITDTRYAVRWYQSPEAEFLELSPHALVALNFQKKLCVLLLRHIAALRFGGVVIQIARSTLLHMPTFKTVSALMRSIDELKYRRQLPYQVMIYNDQADAASDAVILRPETAYQKYPKLWEAMRHSFQDLIERIHSHHHTTSLQQPTILDFLMPPTQALLAAISSHPSLYCQAIHLIGFGLPEGSPHANPLLKTYQPQRWPRILVRAALVSLILMGAFAAKEHVDLQKKIRMQEHELSQIQHDIIAQKLMHDVAKRDPSWSSLIAPSKLPPLEDDWRTETQKAFNLLPTSQQVAAIYSGLKPMPVLEKTEEINAYIEHIARLACAMKNTPKDPNCLATMMSGCVHHWIAQELHNLEETLLPIDLHAPLDPSIRINQLSYLLKHPEIVGEHVHQRLVILERALKQHPNAQLSALDIELQTLVESFKESASYKALQYVFARSTQDPSLPRPELHPLNRCDQRLMDRILPESTHSTGTPAPLMDLAHSWDQLYQAYLPLSSCFPLNHASTQDCDPQTFAAFFTPNTGLFDRLWPQFAPMIQEQQGKISIHPEWLPYVDASLADRYMQVRLIQAMFFEKNQATARLRLRPEMTDKDLRADLHIQNHHYAMTAHPHLDIPIQWSFMETQRIELQLALGQEESKETFSGPWAILRFIKHYLTPEGNALRIRFLDHEFRMRILSTHKFTPWQHQLYDRFSLPQQLLLNTQHNPKESYFQAPQAEEAPSSEEYETLVEGHQSAGEPEPFELHESILEPEEHIH